jgi:type I phosphodiesterase/nucleotide pyrophosphatase
MSLTEDIEAQIRAERETRFAGLNLPPEFVAPNYGGCSIVNVPASIVRLFGGLLSTASLDPAFIKPLAADVRRVVLVVIDALGYQRFRDTLTANPDNGFHALLRNGGQLAPLTSVFPSTTTAALTALWSGYTPAEHGFMGYQLFLRDYDVRANMIGFSPVATQGLGREQLVAAGLEPETFLVVPSLPQTLSKINVPVYGLIEQPFVKSALSRVQIRGVKELRGFVTSSDMWIALRTWMMEHPAERAMFVAYWSAVDGIAHTYGPSSETVVAEVNNLAYSFEREFLSLLPSPARKNTLFLFTADHGQVDTPLSRAVRLRDHPELRNRLVMGLTGEARAAYLYCRNGEVEAVRQYFETRLNDRFFLMDSQAALRAGLFGPGRLAPETQYRIGDLVAVSRGPDILWDRTDPPTERGRHGGLLADEMLVPFIAARLDA